MDLGFDLRWKLHPKPQATTDGILWRKTGWRPENVQGLTVLDAGCGCGRFAAVAGQAGATVVGIDSSPHAIESATANYPGGTFAVVDLLDADGIADLVAASGPFDRAYSIGVLHHTADPARAFANLSQAVKAGGQLAVWVYAKPFTRFPAALDMFHEITRACPPEKLHDICARYACLVRDEYARTPPTDLHGVIQASTSTDDEECISDTFDWHCPQHRSWHTVDEVCGWFTSNGFSVDWIGPAAVSVRGTRRP